MRLVIAACIWLVLVGGLFTYMHERDTVGVAEQYQPRRAVASYAIEITPTFSAEPDPFTLQSETGRKASAIILRLNGKEIPNLPENAEQGSPIFVNNVQGLVEGLNEFYLEAAPPVATGDRIHAIRVRVLRDGLPVAERSFWSGAGSKIAVTFPLEIELEPQEKGHPHEH
jgi:hypothetical protein